jgi:hypothetical protein
MRRPSASRLAEAPVCRAAEGPLAIPPTPMLWGPTASLVNRSPALRCLTTIPYLVAPASGRQETSSIVPSRVTRSADGLTALTRAGAP